MGPLTMWLLAYLLPVAAAIVAFLLVRRALLVIVHVALLVSIATSASFILSTRTPFPFTYSAYSLALLVAAGAVAIWLLRLQGAGYLVSATVQEATMLSITALLVPRLPIPLIVLLVVPVFSLSHLIEPKHWELKIPLTLTWGVITVLLYVYLHEPLLNAALHTLAGTFLIQAGIIYSH